MAGIPKLQDVPPAGRIELFRKKLLLTSYLLDFNNLNAQQREKEIKRQQLNDLISFVLHQRDLLSCSDLYAPIFAMVSCNLLRPLPARSRPSNDEQGNKVEAAWGHIELVYIFLLSCLRSPSWHAPYAVAVVGPNFIRELMKLFESEDTRERQQLKSVVHRLYQDLVPLRSVIRQHIGNSILEYVHEGKRHHGLVELLTVLESIIDGLRSPLREEHRNFFIRILVLLYKSSEYKTFHQQLTQCAVRFIRKDPELCTVLFSSILRYWPKAESERQVLLLRDIGVLLPRMPQSQIPCLIFPLFKRIGKCIASDHFMSAEVALTLFSSEHTIILVADHTHIIVPLLYGPLSYSLAQHWHSRTRAMCDSILQLFAEIDLDVFVWCERAYHSSELEEGEKWRKLERQAERCLQAH